MKHITPLRKLLSLAVLACSSLLPANAAQILNNGGFESGLAGWTTTDALGSDGTFAVQTGTTSPINGDTVPAPAGGTKAAMTDGAGPGSHLLYQDFVVVSAAGVATLSFDLFIGNRAELFATPAPGSLDFGINAANQQARIDILKGSATAFSLVGSDVLLNVYQSNSGDALISGYTHLSFDVTGLVNANLGTTLRLRFAEVDNLAPLQLGVDNVSLDVGSAGVPEPASALTMGAGLVAMGFGLLRRRRHSLPRA